jgi:GT2 family glycosyltransferase
MNITVITTCYGRLRFLQHALPEWAHAGLEDVIVVTGDDCPDDTAAWCKSCHAHCHVVAFPKHEGRTVFHKPTAVNAGATIARGEWLLLLDADTLAHRGIRAHLAAVKPRRFALVRDDYRRRDLTGVLLVERRRFAEVGGLDPRMKGWGAEDIDIRLRLRFALGLEYDLLPDYCLNSLAHDDDLRVVHYAEKDPEASNARNSRIMDDNFAAATGKRLGNELAHSRELRELLGIENSLRQQGLKVVSDKEVGYRVEE